MPTENRSSNTEMVSVPRYLAEEINAALINHGHVVLPRGLQEAMNAQADQHQGEPVAWRGLNELGEIVTEWIDGAPPKAMVDLSGNQASFASLELAYTHADPGEAERLRSMFDQTDADLRLVTAERDTLRAEADRLRQEVASIDKKLRGNVSDPDPLNPIMPGALSITTTYGLVAGIVRERDQLKKALGRQPS